MAVPSAIADELKQQGIYVWRVKVYRDGTIEAKTINYIPGSGTPPEPKPIQLPLFPDD
jgi:hypothetical protein